MSNEIEFDKNKLLHLLMRMDIGLSFSFELHEVLLRFIKIDLLTTFVKLAQSQHFKINLSKHLITSVEFSFSMWYILTSSYY